jgi:WD40 repeat protein
MSIAPVRRCFLLLALPLIWFAAVSQPAVAQGTQEVRSLQQRLTDAKCYTGPLDGVMNASVTGAVKQCPDTEPVLTIETGMHVAPINRVGVDRNCRMAVTGSNDKTVRLWSLADGKLQRTLRVPVGSGNHGRVYAVAMSPDGKTIAAGGWDAYAERRQTVGVYLFDASSGAMTARLGDFENVIDHLAFSPDGRTLAATLGGGGGLRLLDLKSGSEIAADKDYGKASNGATFGPDGRLFTVSDDGYLRSYDRSFKLSRKIKTTGGNDPLSVAVDEAGEKLAVGFDDSTAVEVYRTSDLGLAYAADTRGIEGGNFASVVWSRTGNQLIAGGMHAAKSSFPIVVWENGGRGPRREITIANGSVTAFASCGDGFTVATASPAWARLEAGGNVTQGKSSVTVDMRGKRGDAFQVSRDGGNVRFGMGYGGGQPALFDLGKATLTADAHGNGLVAPKIDSIAVADWLNNEQPKLGGTSLALRDYETSRSLAVTPDASGFVLGTEWNLRAFDRSGKQQWEKPGPGIAWGVNVAGDGRLLVAAHGDGTIRWYRMSDGQELLALFVNKDDRRWVAWTPSGYYQASPGGEDLFGWHVNRGWNQAADFFPASRFRDRFSRPDIVQQVLVTLDEAKAIEQANGQANIRTDSSSAASRLPPVVKILSPVNGTTVNGSEVTIEYELRSPSGLPVDGIEVQIDGRPTRGFQRVDSKVDGARVERQVVSIPARDVQIGLVARSGVLASDVSSVQLKWAGAAATKSDDRLKPKLYGLLVGISTYKDSAINLKYAAKDARDFAEALRTQQGGLYREVELKVLTDGEATTAEIKKGLIWLERSVTSRDFGLVFFAGHGVTDTKNRYYYLTADSDYKAPEEGALEGLILKDRARSIAGKMLVFLDTCHAGQAMVTRGASDINAVVSELSSTENGVVTFASSTGRQLSQENESWHNGAFTKALIEGLPAAGRKGKADITNKGVITTATLDFWLSERVKELTGGSQSPVMSRPQTIPDFPLFAAVR